MALMQADADSQHGGGYPEFRRPHVFYSKVKVLLDEIASDNMILEGLGTPEHELSFWNQRQVCPGRRLKSKRSARLPKFSLFAFGMLSKEAVTFQAQGIGR